MSHLGMRDQVLEEVERRCVQPLQIVQKQGERVLFPREYAEEAPEDHLEPALRILRWQPRDRWLLSDHERQFRNEVHDQLAVRAQRFAQGFPPPAKLRLALAQQWADKALERLGQGSVRDVALVLVELARGEEAARRHEGLVKLIHHRGFADAGKAGDQDQLGSSVSDDAAERRQQGVDFALPPVQPLRDQQTVRRILRTEWKRVDPPERLPCGKAPP